jgi:hypothetical protein
MMTFNCKSRLFTSRHTDKKAMFLIALVHMPRIRLKLIKLELSFAIGAMKPVDLVFIREADCQYCDRRKINGS